MLSFEHASRPFRRARTPASVASASGVPPFVDGHRRALRGASVDETFSTEPFSASTPGGRCKRPIGRGHLGDALKVGAKHRPSQEPSETAEKTRARRQALLDRGLCHYCGVRPRALRARLRFHDLRGMRGPGEIPLGDNWKKAFIKECEQCSRYNRKRFRDAYRPKRRR